jgi:RND family efflux transporter MFP subunit
VSRKKQIIIPVLVLAAGVAMFAAFSSMKKPPEEKEKVDNTPIVAVEQVSLSLMVMEVESYGIVKPKYETELVAQVSGQIVDISDTFVRGGFVKQGQLLARIDPNDYQAALIEAEATLASASASLETERAQGKVAADEWLRIKNSTPSELSLRKPQLAQELARVKAAQAAVKRAKRNLERTAIVAPYDAMIDVRHIGLGSFVSTGAPIGKLLGTNEAELRLPVADNQLQFLLDQGKQAQVILTGEFAGISTEWQASITRDEGVIDGTSRMSYLVAHIADPYALHSQETPLRFGSYVNARIQGMQVASAAIVPRHLVVDGKVAVLDTDSKLRYLPITIVRHTGADVVVSSGLAQGDQVIVSALDYPVDGMKLALLTEDEPDVKPDSVAETQIASASIKD